MMTLLPRIPLGLMVSAHQHDAGELPMRARRGLQRDGVHAGDVEQAGFSRRMTSSAPWESDSGW